MIRHPNSKVRELIAELAVKAAKNDKIGYDPSKITVPCEEDCSAGVMANVKAAGYLRDIEALKNAGFEILTASKHLKGPDYLKRGDILLNDAKHIATNVEVENTQENQLAHQQVVEQEGK